MKKTLFISHISDETDVAQWLKARLDRDFLGGLEIFVSSDRSTIEAGRRWLDEVYKALKNADRGRLSLSDRGARASPTCVMILRGQGDRRLCLPHIRGPRRRCDAAHEEALVLSSFKWALSREPAVKFP